MCAWRPKQGQAADGRHYEEAGQRGHAKGWQQAVMKAPAFIVHYGFLNEQGAHCHSQRNQAVRHLTRPKVAASHRTPGVPRSGTCSSCYGEKWLETKYLMVVWSRRSITKQRSVLRHASGYSWPSPGDSVMVVDRDWKPPGGTRSVGVYPSFVHVISARVAFNSLASCNLPCEQREQSCKGDKDSKV